MTHGSWAYPPNVIELGSLHVRDAKPLPKDLKQFMDSASKGVVYVSFGSALKGPFVNNVRVRRNF